MAIQVSVENVQGLERRLKVCVPVETVNTVVEACFQKAAKTIKMDGFRPGKVPRMVIEKRFGESIRHHEALPKLIDDTLGEAFETAGVSPVGQPSLEGPIDFVPHQDLNYSVLFDVFPEIVLKDLKGSEVEHIVSSVTDDDLQKALDRILQEHTKWEDIKTAAQANDNVLLSYTVEVDGALVDEAKIEKKPVHVGKHTNHIVIPAIEDQLIGLSAGDEKVFEVTFPEEYFIPSVAGKTAKVSAIVHSVQRPEIPVLDDEFVKRFDEAGSVEDYKKNIRKSMDYYLKMALTQLNKLSVFDALVAANPIDLPKVMVRAEIERMAKGFLQNMFRGEKIPQQELKKYLPFLSKMYSKAAERRVRLGLLFEELLKLHPQTITDEMIQVAVEERSSLYQDPKAWIEEYLAEPKNKEEIRNILLEVALADKLRETAEVKEVKLDYFGVLEKEKALQYRDMDMDASVAQGAEEEQEHVHDESCGHGHHHHHHDSHEEETEHESK